MAETGSEPLFTKPDIKSEPEPDEQDSPLGIAAIGALFAFFAVGVNIWWTTVSLPADSLAGGRNASMRRLVGRVGQLPMTIVLGAIAVLCFALAIAEFRKQTKQER
jgi:uncharacterized RDD family membrane protein YckC